MHLRRNASLASLMLLLGTGTLHLAVLFAQQNDSGNQERKAGSAVGGQSTFNSSCAGCHGLDGRGSDKAVNIAGGAKVRHLSDAQLASIIANGIPGTGMPAFHDFSVPQIRAVVGYLRSLQGKRDSRTLPGDAVRGKAIFFGKGECSFCHTISGEGGFLGPDLSAYGSGVSANAIRAEIVRSQRTGTEGYRSGVVITAEGDRLDGIIRNEDNFSVQFQTQDGRFHFFQKSEVRNLEHLGTSIMPTNYRERLSPGELNDLVSYLMNTAPAASRTRTSGKKEEHAE
jgi:putative heme-binding domain-containing protein